MMVREKNLAASGLADVAQVFMPCSLEDLRCFGWQVKLFAKKVAGENSPKQESCTVASGATGFTGAFWTAAGSAARHRFGEDARSSHPPRSKAVSPLPLCHRTP